MPHRPGPPWEYGHHWVHAWGAGGPFLSILITVWWLVLLAGLAWLAWWWLGPHLRPWLATLLDRETSTLSALEILRQRYASGEIDDETFEHMQERLEASYYWHTDSGISAYQRYRQREMRQRRERRATALLQSSVRTTDWERCKKRGGERTCRPVRAYRSVSSRQEVIKRGRLD